MREHYTEPGEARSSDPGDHAGASAVLAPAAAELIGDEALGYIDRSDRVLSELDRLGSTADPFAHDERGSEADLSFLKPKQTEIVMNYHGPSRPFTGMTAREIAKFGRRSAMRLRGIHKDVLERLEDAAPVLKEVGEEITRTAVESPNNLRVSMLPELQQLMGDLVAARDRSPSRATFVVVDNLYAATVSSRSHATNIMENRGLTLIPRKMGEFTDDIRRRQTTFKEVARAGGKFRASGSELFKEIRGLITIEQIKEAAALLDIVDAAKQRLPAGNGLEGDELEATIAAEEYLTASAARAASILKDSDPSILRDKKLGPIIRRLSQHTPGRSRETESEEALPALGNDVLGQLTEAKNIMRGGRRLKPNGNGQTEREIKRTADELHALKDGEENALLNPEESGVIVAMVTGKFESFARVFTAIRQHAGENGMGAFPADRLTVAHELNRFNLDAALAKIGALIEDPDTRLMLERVLGVEKTREVQETVSRALEPETAEAAEEAA